MVSARAQARFWSRVDRRGPDECWPWKGWCDKDGYGRTKIEGRRTRAHRFAWEFANGRPIPPELNGLHTCDAPICCNPRHVVPGTQAENIADASRKGRMRGGGYRPGVKERLRRRWLGQGDRGRGRSMYRGVYLNAYGKWQAAVKKDGKSIYLGCFETEEQAGSAARTARERLGLAVQAVA